MEYIVFGKPDCVFCSRAKDLLERENESYRYTDIRASDAGLSLMQDMVLDATGAPPRTVPQIFFELNGSTNYIGGYDDLVKHLKGKESLADLEFEEF